MTHEAGDHDQDLQEDIRPHVPVGRALALALVHVDRGSTALDPVPETADPETGDHPVPDQRKDGRGKKNVSGDRKDCPP